jgi:hypothetical protein
MLSGINKLCQQCSKECKQYEQVTVVFCPNYKNDSGSLPENKSMHPHTGAKGGL